VNPTAIGAITLACTLIGVLIGASLRRLVPTHHLGAESRDTMKLGIGLIATMTALVLGLVTASAKSSFDTVDATVRHAAMNVLDLDRLLARYGPETQEMRAALRRFVEMRADMIWPRDSSARPQLEPGDAATSVEALVERLRSLSPRDDAHAALRARAVERLETLLRERWMVAAVGASSVPVPFLVILLFWLTITFASFGLLAPPNRTVLVILFLCALSVSSAVFLVLEMDGPFDGVLTVSPTPLHYALSHLGR